MLKYVPKTRTKTCNQAPKHTQNRIRHHRGTISVEKRYQWSRKRFWDIFFADRTISLTTACVSTVPNSSFKCPYRRPQTCGWIMKLLSEGGTSNCLCLKVHRNVGVSKNTHLYLFLSRMPSQFQHNPTKRKALPWNVSELHRLKMTDPWKRVHSYVQILAGEIYWNVAEDTLCYKSFSPCKVSKRQEATLKKS